MIHDKMAANLWPTNEPAKTNKVATLYETNYRDIAATLRIIATEVESGEKSSRSMVIVSMEDDEQTPIKVHGLGEGDAERTFFLLNAGLHEMNKALD